MYNKFNSNFILVKLLKLFFEIILQKKKKISNNVIYNWIFWFFDIKYIIFLYKFNNFFKSNKKLK